MQGSVAAVRTDIPDRPARFQSILIAVGLLVGLALAVAACGEGNDTQAGATTPSSPTTSTTNPVRCDDLVALRDSVAALANVTVQSGMAEELKADLVDVQASLAALADSIGADFQDSTDALQSSLGALGTALDALAANPNSQTSSAVGSALRDVKAALAAFATELTTRCPELSASPTS